jgi:hypothetical protein
MAPGGGLSAAPRRQARESARNRSVARRRARLASRADARREHAPLRAVARPTPPRRVVSTLPSSHPRRAPQQPRDRRAQHRQARRRARGPPGRGGRPTHHETLARRPPGSERIYSAARRHGARPPRPARTRAPWRWWWKRDRSWRRSSVRAPATGMGTDTQIEGVRQWPEVTGPRAGTLSHRRELGEDRPRVLTDLPAGTARIRSARARSSKSRAVRATTTSFQGSPSTAVACVRRARARRSICSAPRSRCSSAVSM